MAHKLTYVELDVDYCLNDFGVAKCSAFLTGELKPFYEWGFQDTIEGFTTTANATFVAGPAGALLTTTGTNPILRSPAGLSIDGSIDYKIEIDIERTANGSGTDGKIYYTTSGGGAHGETGSFYKDISAQLPTLGNRVKIVADMSALTAGGTDWVTSTITQLRFDFDQTGTGQFRIYSIRIGRTAVTGDSINRKCYKTLRTCQDIANFSTSSKTMRFCVPSSELPTDIDAIPSIESIDFIPPTVSLGDGIGQRATLTVVFQDHPHSDAGFNDDPYLSSRGWDAFKRGTFWGKFRARYPYVQGRALRIYRGEIGQTLAEMECRHYVMESYDGPNADNTFTIVAKDILKLADDKRAVAPAYSRGYLASAIEATDTGCTLVPSGVGAEYPDLGIANLGGNEVVTFVRMRSTQEASCVLALHLEGLDASTTITDSSTYAHTITRNGNAQIDTGFFRIGTSALLLDGTDDWIRCNGEAEFAYGTGDFTISMWCRFAGFAQDQYLYDSRPAATNGNYLTVFFEQSTGRFRVMINSVNVLSAAARVLISIPVDRFYNVVLMRQSGVMYLFIDGVLEDSAANTTNLLNGAQRPVFGANGNTITAGELAGSLDEIAIFNEAIFDPLTYDTPLGVAFPDTSNRDSFAIQRGLYGTTAKSRSADDKFQLCLKYSNVSPAYIINDLFRNYANIPEDYIPLSAWEAEVNTFLQRNFGAVIAEPTGVSKLVGELIEQGGMYMWWDDLNQKIRLRVMRPIDTDAALLDENLFLEGSINAVEQFDKRATQIWTYYGQIDPTDSVEKPNNYRSTTVTVDLQEESNFGSPAIRRVYARWIPQFGRSTALRLNDLMIGRFKFPPRKFSFSTFGDLSRETIILGEGYNAEFRTFQDDTGARDTVPVIITRLNPRQDVYVSEAEEAVFAPFDAAALANRVIVIDTDTNNFNLRTVHDSIFPEIVDPTGITLRCIIEDTAIVGADWEEGTIDLGRRPYSTRFTYDNTTKAFDVGSWPVGLDITIEIRGQIRGCGGMGGLLFTSGIFTGTDLGQDGGTALYTRYPIKIESADATPKIAGGGGGGASGKAGVPTGAGAGGGGAGRDPGPGGLHRAGSTFDPTKYGSPGTLDFGGSGYSVGPDGGNPGANGQDSDAGLVGGAGGYAIDGVSYVTYTVATPTIIGSTVN